MRRNFLRSMKGASHGGSLTVSQQSPKNHRRKHLPNTSCPSRHQRGRQPFTLPHLTAPFLSCTASGSKHCPLSCGCFSAMTKPNSWMMTSYYMLVERQGRVFPSLNSPGKNMAGQAMGIGEYTHFHCCVCVDLGSWIEGKPAQTVNSKLMHAHTMCILLVQHGTAEKGPSEKEITSQQKIHLS